MKGKAMARTESISIQVHPKDEQEQINVMQKFHWSLLSSQEVKTVDSHLERRGDTIYSVTNAENYVKLVFSRDLDLPNLGEIKRIEQAYFSLPLPKFPKLFPGGLGIWIVLAFFTVGIVAWPFYYLLYYRPKKNAAFNLSQENATKRQPMLTELAKYE